MKRLELLFALACGASALACSTILGLQEPTIANTIGDAGGGESGGDTGGDGGAGPVQLFNARVRHIALDDTYVYYTELFDLVVGRIGKDGTGQVALANGSAVTGYYPDSIALDATNVYWASVAGLHFCAKTGCGNSPTHLIDENADASTSYSPGGVNVDDTRVYFVNYESSTANSICAVPKTQANAPVTVLVPSSQLCPQINRMQLSSGYLYFTCDNGQVARWPTAGGAIETLSTQGAPTSADAFVLVGSSMYYSQFLEQATIFQLPLAPASTSTPVVLTQPYVNGIDADGQYLYWANVGVTLDNGGGSIARCSISQCSTTVSTLTSKIDIPIDVKVDPTSIFWCANGNGDTPNTGVWKMPKPL